MVNSKRGNILIIWICLAMVVVMFIFFNMYVLYSQVDLQINEVRKDIFYIVQNSFFSMDMNEFKYYSYKVDSNVMKIYNKYAPIVTIVEALKNITPANMSIFPNDEASTGYYKTQYPNRDIGTEISNAIQLYNKLGTDQKDIVKNE